MTALRFKRSAASKLRSLFLRWRHHSLTRVKPPSLLSATPTRPACPSRASGWPSLATQWGFPCCARFPCVHAAATTPVQRLAHAPNRISLPWKGCRVALHIVLFEVCSAFTRVAACTLALSPIRDTLIEGFNLFVTSMTAPVASSGSEFPGWDLHPLESAAVSRRTPISDVLLKADWPARGVCLLQRVKAPG